MLYCFSIISKKNNLKAFFIVSRDPGDRETFETISSFVRTVGGENVLVDDILKGSTASDRDEEESPGHTIPQPRLNNSCNNLFSVNIYANVIFLHLLISISIYSI